VFDSGDPRHDVTALLQHVARTKKPEAFCRVWPRVIGYAASNPAFAKALRARILDGHRAQLAALLQSAIDKGELRPSLDMETALDVLLGPILYRRFMQTTVPPELPEHIVDSFWRLNAPESSVQPANANGDKRKERPSSRRPNGASNHHIPQGRRVR
jgi:hypothetical protein